MSTQPPWPPSDDESAVGADATREIARPQVAGQPPTETSPWARPAGPLEPAPRFAGQPYAYQPDAYPPDAYPPDAAGSQYGQPLSDGSWQSPDPGFAPPYPGGWSPVLAPQSPPRRRGLWALVGLLIVALVAGTITAVAVSSDSKKSSATPSAPLPTTPATPGPSASSPASPSPSPTPSLPGLGLVPTPPALLAIGYHAYSLRLLAQSEVSLGPGEDVQFKRYGLSRIVGLRALTLGNPDLEADDWDASINILRFRDAASAKAELAYSNAQNLKSPGAKTIPLPGLPTATGFLNAGDATTGLGVGAFTTVGRYQVVVILNGLSPNLPSDGNLVAAETARVMKAILPVAATIEPKASGGSTPQPPTLPTPTPTGTRA